MIEETGYSLSVASDGTSNITLPMPEPDTGRVEQRKQILAEQSVVYYVQAVPGVIKIGTTTNVRHRMIGLRFSLDAVMATEPGDVQLERMRHRQFSHLRHGRREDFSAEPELLSHIRMVREHCGEPNITTYPRPCHA